MNQVKPLTVEQQLKRMSEWLEAIESRPAISSATSPEILADCWETLETSPHVQANKSYLERGRTRGDMPPLAALFEYAAAGYYPPPELLLTLVDAWQRYTESTNDLTLEEAFFGKPVPKAGNYAKRAMKKRKDLGAAFQIGEYQSQGKTKAEAVKLIAKKFGGSEESLKKINPIPPLDSESEK